MASRRTRKAPGKGGYHHGDLRAALIKASRRLVRESGPAAFSLREAARLVGVDPAACYRHFRAREDVLVAIAQEGFADLAELFAKTRQTAPAASAHEALLMLGEVYLGFALARPAEFRLMFGEAGVPSVGPPMRTSHLEKSPYDHLNELSARYLAGAGDPTALANMLWSATHGVTRLVLDGALVLDEGETRGLVRAVVSAVLAGYGR